MGGRPRVGVSACIIGEPVRYSGGHCQDPVVMRDLAPHVDLVPMCPEVEAGLGAPRESLHLEGATSSPRLVGFHTGMDQAPRLVAWSRDRARAVDALDLDGFVLKKGSPTCGMERVRVYQEADKRPRYDGVGVFARELISRFPDLPVEEEGRLHDLGLREHFITRVFASRRWRDLVASGPNVDELTAFHVGNELLVLAHDEQGYQDLTDIIEEMDSAELPPGLLTRYGDRFLRALSGSPTHARHHEVLLRLFGEVHLRTQAERRDLAAVIDEYRRGWIPLTVPARLLLHLVRRDNARVRSQTWFAPWPEGIRLRTHVTLE